MSGDDRERPLPRPLPAAAARPRATQMSPERMRAERPLKGPGEIAPAATPATPKPKPTPVATEGPRPARVRATKTAAPERQAAQRLGLSAESRAAALLIFKGYRILARRFRTPVGEIDIVAGRRDTVVFVEVKARDTLDLAAEAVSPRQRHRIIDAAQYWLAARPDAAGAALRFDVILVAPGTVPQHLMNAFDATD